MSSTSFTRDQLPRAALAASVHSVVAETLQASSSAGACYPGISSVACSSALDMKSKVESDVLAGLSSIEADARLHALRSLKNTVIGDKRKKASFVKLGAVQLLVEIMSSDSEPALLIQAAAAIGSFAASEEGVKAVVEHGAIPQLLRALHSSETRVVEAAVRSLKMVYKSPLAPKECVFASDTPQRLVSLLSAPITNVPEAASSIIASCCETQEQQEALVAAGAVPPLIVLLSHERQAKQEAGLESLAALTRGSPAAAAACLAHEGVVDNVLGFLKHPSPHTRFLACVCLTNMCQQLPGPNGGRSRQEVQQAVLPVLVRLLGECVGEREDVPSVLCQLVAESEELQQAATDADAIAKLAVFVRDAACPPRRKEGALRTLGMLCASAEANRRQLFECCVLPQLAGALAEEGWPPLRAAACLCMRSLSRSTNLMRNNLGDVDVAAPLLRLTEEEDVTVAWQAAAALANLTVDCTSIKEAVLQRGGVQRFVSLSQSMHQQLRLYGVWGLSSIAFRSAAEVRDAIMQQLPWSSLVTLLDDPEPDIREKAVLLLRNLAYNALPHSQQQGQQSQSHQQPAAGGGGGGGGGGTCSLQGWSGGEVLCAVRRVLERPDPSLSLKEHALYVVVNMASGSEEQKAAVVAHGWPRKLLAHMDDADWRIREAAVWAVINLSWSKDGDSTAPERIQAMRDLGVEEKLRSLQHDESQPVKERAQVALLQFGGDHDQDEEMRQIEDEIQQASAAAAAAAQRLRMHFRD